MKCDNICHAFTRKAEITNTRHSDVLDLSFEISGFILATLQWKC